MDTIEHPIHDLTGFLILYFQVRHVSKWGYVGYKVYSKLISHCTGIRDSERLRFIWSSILKSNHIVKRKIKTRTEYRFFYNPQ